MATNILNAKEGTKRGHVLESVCKEKMPKVLAVGNRVPSMFSHDT